MQFAELTQEVQVARPQQANFNVGLTPGRRRINREYKEAVTAAQDKGCKYYNVWLDWFCTFT